ncbi:MAG: hypothetical protein COA79_05465 [Planctomycetota bacterium]|nr:MAG: hypothetical protein COA79_05465 [Planctomycetota bacterium]
MIHHILIYKFKIGIDRIEEHLEMIIQFKDNVDGLVDLKCGRNINEQFSLEFTHGFIMTFVDQEALLKYNQSESHSKLVNTFKDDIENKKVIDFEDFN